MSTLPPKRPGKNAGDVSARTLDRRGPMPLTAEQRRRARFLRFDVHWDWPLIVLDLGRSERDIRHSLASCRTPRTNPKRGTINVGLAALAELRARQLKGEAMWETVNRLLGL